MLAQLVSSFMSVVITSYTHPFLITNILSVILVISFTGQVTTILKFSGSSMIWQIVTKSPIPPIETPNPSITIWSNAANVAALIKLDYLNTILSWLDIVGPKSSSGWNTAMKNLVDNLVMSPYMTNLRQQRNWSYIMTKNELTSAELLANMI